MGLNEDVMAYATELAEAAGITDATARDAFLKNDKVQSRLRAKFEDVSREKGRAEAEKKRADDEARKAQENYQANLKVHNDNKVIFDAAAAEVARYEAAYGKLEPGARAAAVQDVIDAKTFNERIGQTEANTVGLVKAAATITARHLKNFNEEPDFDAIQKIATEKQLTAMKAYEEWAAPKYEEKQKVARAAETQQAVDAALMEDRSKRAASQTVDASQRSEFLNNAIKSKNEPTTAKESFLKGWREPNASAEMKKEFGRDH